jgi:hypothetical protein
MNEQTQPRLAVPLACARLLSSADAVLRDADRLREARDELLHAIRHDDPTAADDRREVAK